jgi:hypothetical protein
MHACYYFSQAVRHARLTSKFKLYDTINSMTNIQKKRVTLIISDKYHSNLKTNYKTFLSQNSVKWYQHFMERADSSSQTFYPNSYHEISCGRGSRTPDLWVMNPTRYLCATPRRQSIRHKSNAIISKSKFLIHFLHPYIYPLIIHR